jgi:hypothetical protein
MPDQGVGVVDAPVPPDEAPFEVAPACGAGAVAGAWLPGVPTAGSEGSGSGDTATGGDGSAAGTLGNGTGSGSARKPSATMRIDQIPAVIPIIPA